MNEAEIDMAIEMRRREALKEKAPPVPPSRENAISSDDLILQKRRDLDLRRIEIELEKLAKPDTSVDYYSKMLELQEKSFKAQLEMLQQQSNLKIEIEKLKLAADNSGDFAEDFLYGLLPMLPELIKQQQAKEKLKGGDTDVKKMISMMTAKDLEEYKLKIRAGVITLEQAYEDFQKAYPEMKDKITKEQFQAEYEKIKNPPKKKE